MLLSLLDGVRSKFIYGGGGGGGTVGVVDGEGSYSEIRLKWG